MSDLLNNQADVWFGAPRELPRSLPVGPTALVFTSVAEARKALTNGHTTEQRVAAVWCLASADEEFSEATLVAALFDTEEEVAQAAAQALSQLRNPVISTGSIENLFVPENNRHSRNSSTIAVADLNNPHAEKRISALATIGNLKHENAFHLITDRFDDECADVRAAAVDALHDFDPERAAEYLTDALNVASPTGRSRMVEAIEASSLGAQLIDDLTREDRERARAALSLLLLMAQMNAVRPLIEAIERHESAEVRRSLVRILNLTGRSSLAEAAARRRLGIPS
jgi:HEAT repeat protein